MGRCWHERGPLTERMGEVMEKSGTTPEFQEGLGEEKKWKEDGLGRAVGIRGPSALGRADIQWAVCRSVWNSGEE